MVVGLFCTWSLNYRTFEPYLSEIVPIDTIRKIDIPPPPAEVLEIYTEDEKLEVPLAEVREKVADGCGHCPDMTAEFTDLSVGVFEGQIRPEHADHQNRCGGGVGGRGGAETVT